MTKTSEALIRSIVETDSEMSPDEKKTLLGFIAGKVSKKQLITPKEACEILGVCRRTLYAYADASKLTRIKHSQRKIRFDRDEVERLAFSGMAQE